MTEKKLRIMLAEGNSGEISSALRMLYASDQGELEITRVSGVSTLIATLEIVHPEVIFLDLAIVPADPMATVRRVHRSAPAIPLIVLTNAEDKESAVRFVNHGAQGVLLKGSVDTNALKHVLAVALEHNTFEGLADFMRDPLTRLFTRDGFLTLGSRAMEAARSKGSTLVLLCMRIENLAKVRACFGLSAMESSLCDVAMALGRSLRRTDLLARLGESQFAALAVDAVEPSAPVLRQRLERRVQMLNREMGPWGPLDLRMSARFWSPKEALTFPELLDLVEVGLRSQPVQFAEEIPVGKTNT